MHVFVTVSDVGKRKTENLLTNVSSKFILYTFLYPQLIIIYQYYKNVCRINYYMIYVNNVVYKVVFY